MLQCFLGVLNYLERVVLKLRKNMRNGNVNFKVMIEMTMSFVADYELSNSVKAYVVY